MKDKIKDIAERIVALELKCQNDSSNAGQYITKMQQIINNLSAEELIMIDEYIMDEGLLTK